MICKNVKAAISSSLAALLLVGLVGCSGTKTLNGHYTADVSTYNFPKTLNFESDGDCDYNDTLATVYKGNIIKNLIMDCQSYTKYRPNETTGGIFVSWRRKEELPTGA